MAEFSRLIITADGQALLAKIMTGSGNVAFTKISSSSHGYTLEELQSLHELADVEQTSAVSKIERTNAVAVRIETAFSNKELTGGYYMRALGLYALDPDAGEILYAVTAETSGNCYMPAYNGVTVSGAYVQLVTTVGNAENVSLEVNEAGVATVRDIKKLQERMEDLQEMLETGSASVCFDDFPQRENIRPQDTLRVILGKIRKWFADLGAAAFASIANNCATTEEGHVLDARQGTALQEQVDEINGNLQQFNQPLYKFISVSYTYSFTPNSTGTFYVSLPAVEGYVPAAINGYDTNDFDIFFMSVKLESNRIFAGFRNITTSAATRTAVFNILYIRNS